MIKLAVVVIALVFTLGATAPAFAVNDYNASKSNTAQKTDDGLGIRINKCRARCDNLAKSHCKAQIDNQKSSQGRAAASASAGSCRAQYKSNCKAACS